MTARECIFRRRAHFVAVAGVALGCSSERTPTPLAMPCFSYSCSQDPSTPTSLELEPSPDALCIGRLYELNVNKVACDAGGHVTPEWTSSDPSIATVNAVGQVWPIAPGTVRITAVYERLAASKAFDVVECTDGGVADAASDAPDAE